MTLFVDKCFRLSSFKDKVFLIIENKKYVTEGYYDTGNILKFNDIPVIFISKDKCKDNFKITKSMKVSTINGTKMYNYIEALISLGDKKEYHYVYLCFSEEKSFNGCDILLNAYLL